MAKASKLLDRIRSQPVPASLHYRPLWWLNPDNKEFLKEIDPVIDAWIAFDESIRSRYPYKTWLAQLLCSQPGAPVKEAQMILYIEERGHNVKATR